MHETAQLHPSAVFARHRNTERVATWPRWLRIEFLLPTCVLIGFCLIVSADRGYAASGGAEVYNPRMQSNAIRQLAFVGLGATGMYLLTLARPASTTRSPAWSILLPTVAMLGYLLLSTLWSDDPTMTLKRAVTACIVIVTGLGIGRVWTVRDFGWAVVIVSTVFLLLSILVEAQYRAFLSGSDYRFSGIFHPAKQAFNCGFLLVASLSLYYSHRTRWLLALAGVALLFLILTKARTGTAAALLACGWLTWLNSSVRGWLIAGAAMSATALSAGLFYQGVTGKDLAVSQVTTMGRNEETADPTKLTGRLPIWSHAFDQFTAQPVLGYGYGAFWTPSRLAEFERRNGWALFHSHSTYLESLLNLGLVGFMIGTIVILGATHRSIAIYKTWNRDAILVASMLILAAVGGFFEIAFIGLEYESLVMMIGIGVTAFAAPECTGATR